MHKIILFFVLSFSFQSTYSQVWVDNGATWHYEFWQPFMSGYVEMNYDRDTTIDGISCQVIETTQYKFFDGGGFAGSTIRPIQITYVSGDTVFYRSNGAFFVLFDFGAEIGDTWMISDVPSLEYVDCDEVSVIQVTGTGVMDIAGESYRYLDLEPTSNSPYGFVGRYVERFGLLSTGLEQFRYLFPQEVECDGIPDGGALEFGYSGFLCFEDDSFSLYSPTSSSCTKVVSVPENSELVDVKCYPNPATNILEISAANPIDQLQVYSSVGEYVMTVNVSEYVAQIDVSTLSRGIYFFDIRLQNGLTVKRKVVLN
ncbi:MAG: T9SS type A sorting domain-containing protein [Crocinitomix sp.]|nr:T9SS type A sorting domain-containing protein [Crocinitomix sp.]